MALAPKALQQQPSPLPTLGGCARKSAISDHWSRRTIMLIGVATTNLFTLLIPLVQSGEQLIIVRLRPSTGSSADAAVASSH
jgi:hypothetical protein